MNQFGLSSSLCVCAGGHRHTETVCLHALRLSIGPINFVNSLLLNGLRLAPGEFQLGCVAIFGPSFGSHTFPAHFCHTETVCRACQLVPILLELANDTHTLHKGHTHTHTNGPLLLAGQT